MSLKNETNLFLSLVRAGLWEKQGRLLHNNDTVDSVIFRLAQEQAVEGLVAAGIELTGAKCPKETALAVSADVIALEQRNSSMNDFIGVLFDKLHQERIDCVLIKGQGIAQCYERPLWRACGDVDLLLGTEDYAKAKKYLASIAERQGEELKDRLHIDYTIGPWEVELHGSMRNGLWASMNIMLDDALLVSFEQNRVRIWQNGAHTIILPPIDEDVVFVFTHILNHFFKEGIGLRQICDWCRLLWKSKDGVNVPLLESRLKRAGIITEWKVFAALAVDRLGMPKEAMPLYSSSKQWSRKAKRLLELIIKSGNFGHNRDMSYFAKYPFVIRKIISLCHHTSDGIKQFFIFPKDALRVWWGTIVFGIKYAFQGK